MQPKASHVQTLSVPVLHTVQLLHTAPLRWEQACLICPFPGLLPVPLSDVFQAANLCSSLALLLSGGSSSVHVALCAKPILWTSTCMSRVDRLSILQLPRRART